jgi:hypothetical protein
LTSIVWWDDRRLRSTQRAQNQDKDIAVVRP